MFFVAIVCFFGQGIEKSMTTFFPVLSLILDWLGSTLYYMCYCDLLEYGIQSKVVICPCMHGDQPPASPMQCVIISTVGRVLSSSSGPLQE